MSKVQEVSSTIEIIRYEGTRILEEDVALDNSAEEYIDWFCNGESRRRSMHYLMEKLMPFL